MAGSKACGIPGNKGCKAVPSHDLVGPSRGFYRKMIRNMHLVAPPLSPERPNIGDKVNVMLVFIVLSGHISHIRSSRLRRILLCHAD